jgi:hypothetical protein
MLLIPFCWVDQLTRLATFDAILCRPVLQLVECIPRILPRPIPDIVKANCKLRVVFLAKVDGSLHCIPDCHGLTHRSTNETSATNTPAQTHRMKLIKHKHTVREVLMDPIAMFEPDRAAVCSKVRNYTGISVARLYRFRGIRKWRLIPQIPLFSVYTGIIPV